MTTQGAGYYRRMQAAVEELLVLRGTLTRAEIDAVMDIGSLIMQPFPEAPLDIRVTQLAADNTLSRVMTLVAEAQSQQSPTQQITDRFIGWFVPAIFIVTALLIAIPPLLGLQPLRDSFYRGMLLLVAASPCALAIGTPAAVLSGIAQAGGDGFARVESCD